MADIVKFYPKLDLGDPGGRKYGAPIMRSGQVVAEIEVAAHDKEEAYAIIRKIVDPQYQIGDIGELVVFSC
jgi:hypothetical protein